MVFRLAERDETKVLIGIGGPSSSGKTWSALELGTGMVDDPATELGLIDTENGRAKHYADDFRFQYDQLKPPYTPMAYMAKIKEASAAGVKALIVDSTSHVHAGEGGILDWHEKEITRLVGGNDTYARREAMNFAAWAKPKTAWSVFASVITQLDIHLIFCFRAKEKLKLVKVKKTNQSGVEREVNEPTPMGWQPIITEGFDYEMTVNLILPPLSEGRYDVDAEASKIIGAHRNIFVKGGQINREMGRQMVAWARGSNVGKPTILQRGEEAAQRGTEALRIWFTSLTVDDKRRLEPDKDRLKAEAAKHDGATKRMDATDVAEKLDAEDAKVHPALLATGTDDQDRVLNYSNLLLHVWEESKVDAIHRANMDWITKLPDKLRRMVNTATDDARERARQNA